MNCRDIEPLILAERDGGLTSGQHAILAGHVATCPACQQLRARLAEALAAFRTDAANVAVPAVEEEWRTLRAQLHGQGAKSAEKRPLAPVIWFGASLAAAAALTFAFLNRPPKSADRISPDNDIAGAEFVEAGDSHAPPLVYVDKESGWLVVWAADADTAGKG